MFSEGVEKVYLFKITFTEQHTMAQKCWGMQEEQTLPVLKGDCLVGSRLVQRQWKYKY